MKGHEMRAIREEALEMTELELARAIGYTGTDLNDKTRIREYERGKKQIPLYIARLVWLMSTIAQEVERDPEEIWPTCVNETGEIDWPKWTGYEFDHLPDAEVLRCPIAPK